MVSLMDSASSVASEDYNPVSTNPSTPPSTSAIDLPKLSRTYATGVLSVARVRNICCVGAGYVGTYEVSPHRTYTVPHTLVLH